MTSAETRPAAGAADDDHESDLGRLNALVDGVVAIAITLLAIDLEPHLTKPLSSHELAAELYDNLRLYITFAIAFALVAQYWSVHRQVMRRVRRSAPHLTLITFVFLFAITLAPFLTNLNGTAGNDLGAFLFALDIVLLSGSTGTLGLTVWRRHLLDEQETPALRVQHTARLSVNLIIPSLVAGLVWVIGTNAEWLYLLYAFGDVPGSLLARRAARRPSPPTVG